MPAIGRLSGTPASISASDEPQTVAIDDDPFELGDLRDDADRVGEFGRGRQHRTDRPPGELAVADFAPAGRAHAAGLADRIGREVVVEQEPLLVGAVEGIDILLVFAGAERRDDERLGFAAREQRRAVGAGQAPRPAARIGRTVVRSRPSMRRLWSRMFQRTTLAWASWNASAISSGGKFRLRALGRERRRTPSP